MFERREKSSGKTCKEVVIMERICPVCGETFEATTPTKKFCSTKCRERFHYLHQTKICICEVCGKEFKSRNFNKLCPKCNKESKLHACKFCGSMTDRLTGFCSETCRINYERRKKREVPKIDQTLEFIKALGIDYKTYTYYRDFMHWSDKKISNFFKRRR